jgi:hypothetical protein
MKASAPANEMEIGEEIPRRLIKREFGTRRDVNLIDFNPHPGFGWKIAQPIPFPGYEHISTYFTTTLLNFPIFFNDLPDTADDPYYPSYVYIPVEGPDMTHLIRIYDNIQNIIEKNFETCKEYSQSCELWPEGLRDHATDSCCGFTAPVFSVFIHEANKFNVNDEISEEKHNEIKEKAVLYYKELVGYGKADSEFSWNTRCQGWKNNLTLNVNLLSFFSGLTTGPDGNVTCSTYHHFVVFVSVIDPTYSFIMDAWAGTGGKRGKWIRIMMTDHLTEVLDAITKSKNKTETNILINQYFAVPNSAKYPSMNLIINKMYVGNISLDKEEHRIQNLYATERQKHSALVAKKKLGKGKSKKVKGKSQKVKSQKVKSKKGKSQKVKGKSQKGKGKRNTR